ncbi:MAG TPA: ABC transporter permease subunit [Thermoanaerobaculia bacterium]|nr:ABC transporter permease subunit [Thermoanaerobaculia bacterium]
MTVGLASVLILIAAGLPLVAIVVDLPPWRTWSTIAPRGLGTLLFRSLGIAASTTALASLIGLPLGILFGTTDLAGRRLLWVVHAFPMFLPPFLLGLGWTHWFGRRGLLGSEASANVLWSDIGVVLILGLALAPVTTTLVAAAAGSLERGLVEAGRTVAKPMLVLWRIVLPAVVPAAALAGVLIFALAFGELGVPMLLRRNVYPAAALARLGTVAYAPGEAAVLCLPLVPLALTLLAIERRFAGPRTFAVLGLRRSDGSPVPLGRPGGTLSTLAGLVAALGVMPIAALAWRAGSAGGISEVSSWLGPSVRNSLVVAAAAAVAATILGVIVGHSLLLGQRIAMLLDGLLFLVFLLPAAVLGTGMIRLWNRSSTQWLYAGVGILILAATARYTVAALRASAITFAQAPRHWEEAARAAGASYLRRLGSIVLPAGRRGVVAAAALAFVLTLRDVETPILFYPPGWAPLTVRIVTLEANGPEAMVAALALVQVLMTAAALGGAALALRRMR